MLHYLAGFHEELCTEHFKRQRDAESKPGAAGIMQGKSKGREGQDLRSGILKGKGKAMEGQTQKPSCKAQGRAGVIRRPAPEASHGLHIVPALREGLQQPRCTVPEAVGPAGGIDDAQQGGANPQGNHPLLNCLRPHTAVPASSKQQWVDTAFSLDQFVLADLPCGSSTSAPHDL